MAQADAERGDRIKWLREEKLHLTQEAMADKIGITLRGYQEWEAGGGIKWDNTKKLAKAAGVAPDWIMSGDPVATPDLANPSQLDRIEANQQTFIAEAAALRVELGALASQLEGDIASIRVEIGTLKSALEELSRQTGQIARTAGSSTRTRRAK